MAAEREGADQILVRQPSRRHLLPAAGRSDQAALADRARLSGTQAGTRPGTLRGARLARLPSSRHTVHRCLRVPDLREGEDSPLRTSCRRDAPETCRSRRLPTPRHRRSGPSGIYRTRSRQCVDASPSRLPEASTDVRAATPRANRRTPIHTYDAVRLGNYTVSHLTGFRWEPMLAFGCGIVPH